MGHMFRGRVALWQKDWPTAEHYFLWIVIENPHDFAAWKGITFALVEQDDPAKKQRALAYAEANYRVNQASPNFVNIGLGVLPAR